MKSTLNRIQRLSIVWLLWIWFKPYLNLSQSIISKFDPNGCKQWPPYCCGWNISRRSNILRISIEFGSKCTWNTIQSLSCDLCLQLMCIVLSCLHLSFHNLFHLLGIYANINYTQSVHHYCNPLGKHVRPIQIFDFSYTRPDSLYVQLLAFQILHIGYLKGKNRCI